MTVSPSPERIWLIYDKQADEPITWADNPNPYAAFGEQADAAIEYIRADALESAQAEIARLTTALSWFDKHGEHLANDVSSGHSARGSAASEWMREDDADFRRDLREALAVARAALKGNQP